MVTFKSKLIIFLLICTSHFAFAKGGDINEPTPPTSPIEKLWKPVPENKYAVQFEMQPHDADTFDLAINIDDFDIILHSQKVRVENYDSCEVNRVRKTVNITDEELLRGKQARDYVAMIIQKYNVYIVTKNKRDAYGRLLCKVYISDKSHPNLFIDLKDLIFAQGFDRSQL